jgi:hypothetical protein
VLRELATWSDGRRGSSSAAAAGIANTTRLPTFKASFVSTWLGINEHDQLLNYALDSKDLCQPNTSNSPQDIPSVGVANLNHPNVQSAWTEVVKRRQPRNQASNFQQSVVAAVYIDQSAKKKWETSLQWIKQILICFRACVGKNSISNRTSLKPSD